jgi:hypothetical protein
MRKIAMSLPVAVAALAMLSMPALAKSAGAHKAEDKSNSSGCSAYEQAPDGSWKQLPCQAIGSGGQSHQRPAPKDGDDASR